MDFRDRAILHRIGIPRRFWEQGDFTPTDDVVRWVEDFDLVMWEMSSPQFGVGLVLCGQESSPSAAWVIHQIMAYLEPADLFFRDWGSFVDDIMGDDVPRSQAMQSMLTPSVLVIDHVPTHRKEWLDDILSRIIKGRFDEGRPTIITSSKSVELTRANLSQCIEFDPHCLTFVETLGSEG